MIVDHFVDMATSGEIWMPGWRCLMCGEIIDPIIESHRQQQQHHQEIVGAISGSSARPPARLRSIHEKPCGASLLRFFFVPHLLPRCSPILPF